MASDSSSKYSNEKCLVLKSIEINHKSTLLAIKNPSITLYYLRKNRLYHFSHPVVLVGGHCGELSLRELKRPKVLRRRSAGGV